MTTPQHDPERTWILAEWDDGGRYFQGPSIRRAHSDPEYTEKVKVVPTDTLARVEEERQSSERHFTIALRSAQKAQDAAEQRAENAEKERDEAQAHCRAINNAYIKQRRDLRRAEEDRERFEARAEAAEAEVARLRRVLERDLPTIERLGGSVSPKQAVQAAARIRVALNPSEEE